MRKAIPILIFSISLSFFVSAQEYNFQNLVGSWRTKQGAGIEVMDSSHVYLVLGDKKKILTSFKVDFSNNPARFNFEVQDSSNSVSYKSMLLFINEDLVQWRMITSAAKPAQYKETKQVRYKDLSDIIILRKIEERTN